MRVTIYENEAINLIQFVEIIGEALNFPEDETILYIFH